MYFCNFQGIHKKNKISNYEKKIVPIKNNTKKARKENKGNLEQVE